MTQNSSIDPKSIFCRENCDVALGQWKKVDNFRQWVFGTKNSHANIGKIESKIEVIKFFLNFLGGFFSRQRKSFENDTQHEMRLWSHLKHH